MKTKRQQVLDALTKICGKRGTPRSRDDVITALGWGKSVSALLNHLVSDGLVEKVPGAGIGKDGRICSGYRPAAPMSSSMPISDALKIVEQMRAQLEDLSKLLHTAA